ncbi:MAG: hypothetical protein J0H68_09350 [Sphingobacteriia bacterium]|nr:hypothetical protein [Sphingobacteriia bacterium]
MQQHYRVKLNLLVLKEPFYNTTMEIPKAISFTFIDDNNNQYIRIFDYKKPVFINTKSNYNLKVNYKTTEESTGLIHNIYENFMGDYKVHEIYNPNFMQIEDVDLVHAFDKEQKHISPFKAESIIIQHNENVTPYIVENFNICSLQPGDYELRQTEFDYIYNS